MKIDNVLKCVGYNEGGAMKAIDRTKRLRKELERSHTSTLIAHLKTLEPKAVNKQIMLKKKSLNHDNLF